MILEETQLGRGGALTTQACGPGPALVASTVSWGHPPFHTSLCFCQAQLKGQNRKKPCAICSRELWAGAGPFSVQSRSHPAQGSQMISPAQLSQARLSQGGVGEETWLWSLELRDVTKPPQCPGLCLTWTPPGEGDGLWGACGTACGIWLLTVAGGQLWCPSASSLIHRGGVLGGRTCPLPLST